MKIKGADNQG